MIDGVVVNDPSDPGDAFDFSNLTTDNIERIEILRGPQSTLYGSEAMGGVINIITKQGQGTPRTTAFVEGGSYDTHREGVGESGEIGNTSYSIAASEGHTHGFSTYDKKFGATEADGDQTYTLSENIASKLTDNFTLKLTSRYNRNVADFDSIASFTRSDDPLPVNDSRQFNGRVAGELSLLDGKWTQELGISYLDLRRSQITVFYDSFGNELFGRQYDQGVRQTIDWVHHIKVTPDNTLTLGTEAYTDYFKTGSLPVIDVDNRAILRRRPV